MEESKIINTLNETHLHRTLKTIYSLENPGSTTETKVGKYIADILTKDGDVIEIQTGSLAHLLLKTMDFFDDGRKVKVVYPLVAVKYIETKQLDGSIKKRKSPTKKNIYSMFRELTSLCPILLDKRFTLEVLEISMTEERCETEDAVQSKNGRRRFRKNWIKTGKRLEEIRKKHEFHGKKSYMELIPHELLSKDEFLFQDFHNGLKEMETKIKKDESHLALWCFCSMGLVEKIGKKGRFNVYTIK